MFSHQSNDKLDSFLSLSCCFTSHRIITTKYLSVTSISPLPHMQQDHYFSFFPLPVPPFTPSTIPSPQTQPPAHPPSSQGRTTSPVNILYSVLNHNTIQQREKIHLWKETRWNFAGKSPQRAAPRCRRGAGGAAPALPVPPSPARHARRRLRRGGVGRPLGRRVPVPTAARLSGAALPGGRDGMGRRGKGGGLLAAYSLPSPQAAAPPPLPPPPCRGAGEGAAALRRLLSRQEGEGREVAPPRDPPPAAGAAPRGWEYGCRRAEETQPGSSLRVLGKSWVLGVAVVWA